MEYTPGELRITDYPHIDGEPDVEHFRIGAFERNGGLESDVHIAYVDGRGEKENKANAERIVKAVNSFDDMCEALKGLLWITDVVKPTQKLGEYRTAARQALLKTEAK